MNKYKDNLPFVLNDDDWREIKYEYGKRNVEVRVDEMNFWCKVVFWAIPVILFVVLTCFLGVPFWFIPLYFTFSSIAEGFVDWLFVRYIPRKKINRQLAIEEQERNEQELKAAEDRLLKELQSTVFTKEKIFELISKYKNITYPKYLEKDIAKMFKNLETLTNLMEDPSSYRSFFTNHLPDMLSIVAKPRETQKEIDLAKKAISSVTQYAAGEIKHYKLGIAMDDDATLTAYIGLYGRNDEIGGNGNV